MLQTFFRDNPQSKPLITRKAAIGFILLAIIVFPTAYLTWTPQVIVSDAIKTPIIQQEHKDNSITQKTIYRHPIIQLATRFDMALVVTGIIEAFTLICYLALKRVEPYVIAWEKSEREIMQGKSQ